VNYGKDDHNGGIISQPNNLAVRIAAVMIAVVIVGMLISELRHTVSCFLLSFVLAYLFEPLLVLMERRLSRMKAIVILYAGLGLFSLFCLIYLIPFLTIRWEALSQTFPLYLQKIKTLIAGLRESNRTSYAAEEWRWIFDQLLGNLDAVYSKLGGGVYATASTMAFNLLNLLLSPILVFFMLVYKKNVAATITGFLPARYREGILIVGREINRSMTGFIRGQLVISGIVALLVTLALFLLGVDYPILNGIFAGLTSIIPFIGVILAAVPPLFFAYVKFQNTMIMMKVVVAFSVIYFVEGYLVKPLVFRESMDLNPLLTLLMVMALGELMGFWGILLAIPIAASLKIFFSHVVKGTFSTASHIPEP
jgi:putative permease